MYYFNNIDSRQNSPYPLHNYYRHIPAYRIAYIDGKPYHHKPNEIIEIIYQFRYLVEIDWGDRWRAIGRLYLIVQGPSNTDAHSIFNSEMYNCINEILADSKTLVQPVLPSENSTLSNDFSKVVQQSLNKARD